MGNKRRNWYRSWVVDLNVGIARHESGLSVKFSEGQTFPRPEIAIFCFIDGAGEWTGVPENGEETVREFLSRNPNLRDRHSIEARIGRLMKEAERVWVRAKSDEVRNNG